MLTYTQCLKLTFATTFIIVMLLNGFFTITWNNAVQASYDKGQLDMMMAGYEKQAALLPPPVYQ